MLASHRHRCADSLHRSLLSILLPNSTDIHGHHYRRALQTSASTGRKPPPRFLQIVPSDHKDVVGTIGDWFKSGSAAATVLSPWKSAVDFDTKRICEILSRREPMVEASLTALGIRLSEALVISVLRAQKEILPALQFFDWAGRQSEFRHTRNCYHMIFKMLYRAREGDLILDWLARLSGRRRELLVVRFHDTLVMGYAIAGRLDIALQVFSRMRFQGLDLDTFAYNVLLNALAENKAYDVFNVVSKQLATRGLGNSITACICVKCLCGQGRFKDAVAYLRRASTADENAAGVLIDFLSKTGKQKEAESVAKEFSEAGISLAKTDWVSRLVRAGRIGSSSEFFRFTGDFPGLSCYNALICAMLRENRLEEAYELLVEMRERNILPDSYTMNATIGFFCKTGMVDIAIELFDQRFNIGLCPDDYSYSHLIHVLCEYDRIDDAFRVLQEGLKQGYIPLKSTFHNIANFLFRDGKLDKMLLLINAAFEQGLVPNYRICSRLIALLCRAFRAEDAYLLFTKLSNPNDEYGADTYSNLIYGFGAINRGDMASRLLLEMVLNGYSATRGLYKLVIYCLSEQGNQNQVLRDLDVIRSRCNLNERPSIYYFLIDGAVSVGQPDLAKLIFERMLADGISPNLDVKLSMLRGYLKSSKMSDAINFFSSLLESNETSTRLYSAMILGLCESTKAKTAVEYWREARDKGIIPRLDAYEELIHLLCSARNYKMVVDVLKDFEQTGRPPSSYIYNVLLCHTLKSPELQQAWFNSSGGKVDSVFDKFFCLLSGEVSARHSETFEELILQIIPANTVTHNILLRALCKEGKVDYAYDWLNKMRNKNIEPNLWTYDILMHGFWRVGRQNDAQILMDKLSRMGYAEHIHKGSLYRKYQDFVEV